MIKVRIHIKGNTWMDEDVCTDIELPSLPQINSTVHIGDAAEEELLIRAKKSLLIAERYQEWIYGRRPTGLLKEEDLENLDFGDAQYVWDILMIANDPIVHIELNDTQQTAL